MVFLPLGYGYSGYAEQRIIVVGHDTPTQPQVSNEETRQESVAAEPPPTPEPKLYEVRPEDSDPVKNGEAAPQGDVDSIEMIRGGEVAGRPGEDALYLIALKNESVVVARRHWLEGDTLHYVTPSDKHHEVKLAQVDLDLTARLNRERGLIFKMEVLPEIR